MEVSCPNCHVVVRPTDFFCYNCGKNLKPAPPSLAPFPVIWLYTKSILFPPFGIYWAIKYIRQNDNKSKIVGVIAIVVTLISLVITYLLLKSLMDSLNSQLSQQLKLINY